MKNKLSLGTVWFALSAAGIAVFLFVEADISLILFFQIIFVNGITVLIRDRKKKSGGIKTNIGMLQILIGMSGMGIGTAYIITQSRGISVDWDIMLITSTALSFVLTGIFFSLVKFNVTKGKKERCLIKTEGRIIDLKTAFGKDSVLSRVGRGEYAPVYEYTFGEKTYRSESDVYVRMRHKTRDQKLNTPVTIWVNAHKPAETYIPAEAASFRTFERGFRFLGIVGIACGIFILILLLT